MVPPTKIIGIVLKNIDVNNRRSFIKSSKIFFEDLIFLKENSELFSNG